MDISKLFIAEDGTAQQPEMSLYLITCLEAAREALSLLKNSEATLNDFARLACKMILALGEGTTLQAAIQELLALSAAS